MFQVREPFPRYVFCFQAPCTATSSRCSKSHIVRGRHFREIHSRMLTHVFLQATIHVFFKATYKALYFECSGSCVYTPRTTRFRRMNVSRISCAHSKGLKVCQTTIILELSICNGWSFHFRQAIGAQYAFLRFGHQLRAENVRGTGSVQLVLKNEMSTGIHFERSPI